MENKKWVTVLEPKAEPADDGDLELLPRAKCTLEAGLNWDQGRKDPKLKQFQASGRNIKALHLLFKQQRTNQLSA